MAMPVSSDFEVMPESSAEHPRERERGWGGAPGRPGCKRDGESVWTWQLERLVQEAGPSHVRTGSQGDRKPLEAVNQGMTGSDLLLAQAPRLLMMEDEQKEVRAGGWADRMLMPEWTRGRGLN